MFGQYQAISSLSRLYLYNTSIIKKKQRLQTYVKQELSWTIDDDDGDDDTNTASKSVQARISFFEAY